MEKKAVIVSGEAPESDEEVTEAKRSIVFPALVVANSCGSMIPGEARESDEESNDGDRSSYALEPSTCSYHLETKRRGERQKEKRREPSSCVRYNSLLHRKLRECNKSLDRDIKQLLTGSIADGLEQLGEINRRLLRSELLLQDTVNKMQSSCANFQRTLHILSSIAQEGYLHNVRTGLTPS